LSRADDAEVRTESSFKDFPEIMGKAFVGNQVWKNKTKTIGDYKIRFKTLSSK
jgi:hypothetical protein